MLMVGEYQLKICDLILWAAISRRLSVWIKNEKTKTKIIRKFDKTMNLFGIGFYIRKKLSFGFNLYR